MSVKRYTFTFYDYEGWWPEPDEFRAKNGKSTPPFVLAEAYDAACAERDAARQAAEHVRGALRSMERDYKTQVSALAARAERLEGALRHVVALYDAESWPMENDIDIGLLRAALAEREYAAPGGSLSPQAEKLEKEPTL